MAMSSPAPSLRELTATVPLGGEGTGGDEDDAATHRWAKERWEAIHERAKKLAEENQTRRASLPSVAPPSSRSGPRPTLQRRRFASESTQQALRVMRRNYSSAPPPPSEREPRLSRRWLTIATLVLAIDLALVVGSVVARHGWPF